MAAGISTAHVVMIKIGSRELESAQVFRSQIVPLFIFCCRVHVEIKKYIFVARKSRGVFFPTHDNHGNVHYNTIFDD